MISRGLLGRSGPSSPIYNFSAHGILPDRATCTPCPGSQLFSGTLTFSFRPSSTHHAINMTPSSGEIQLGPTATLEIRPTAQARQLWGQLRPAGNGCHRKPRPAGKASCAYATSAAAAGVPRGLAPGKPRTAAKSSVSHAFRRETVDATSLPGSEHQTEGTGALPGPLYGHYSGVTHQTANHLTLFKEPRAPAQSPAWRRSAVTKA